MANQASSAYITAGMDGPAVNSSAVAWGAIIAGAFSATVVTLVLSVLGAGFGLALHTPGASPEHSIAALSIVSVCWLIVVQWISSGLGGYLAGRLRTKSVGVHSDEVFFRDTAHGFLAWCIATLFSVAVVASAASSIGKMGAMAAPGMEAMAGARMHGTPPAHPGPAAPPEPMAYYVDHLFRSGTGSVAVDAETRAEASRILMHDAAGVPAADADYLTQLVSSRVGLSQPDAQKRVNDTLQQMEGVRDDMRAKAEEARKTGAKISIYTALAMLVGAFVASVGGALGGHRRDEYYNKV
jgi:hypothetical protein